MRLFNNKINLPYLSCLNSDCKLNLNCVFCSLRSILVYLGESGTKKGTNETHHIHRSYDIRSHVETVARTHSKVAHQTPFSRFPKFIRLSFSLFLFGEGYTY